MIKSFKDNATADLYNGDMSSARIRKFPKDIHVRAIDKLAMLNIAMDIQDLRVPPANHLEKLKGDLVGYHSIRVNKQWRIIFKWDGGGATHVSLSDHYRP